MHGQGTYVWIGGDKVVGSFIKHYIHGYATLTRTDGTKYVGEFKKGKFHGQGTYTWPGGKIAKGEWHKDKFLGTVTYNNSAVSSNNTGNNNTGNNMDTATMIERAKDTCKSLGFNEGTEKFSDCSLKLYSQNLELAANQNQKVVVQNQGNSSNKMIIYDPVRDSENLQRRALGLINGTCTLANYINC